jgi:hypothetical protein
MQNIYIVWRWDKEQKRYIKVDGGGNAEDPLCLSCEASNWDFIDAVNF